MSEEKYFMFYFHIDSEYVSVEIKDDIDGLEDYDHDSFIQTDESFKEAIRGHFKEGACAVVKGKLLKPRVVRVVEKIEFEA